MSCSPVGPPAQVGHSLSKQPQVADQTQSAPRCRCQRLRAQPQRKLPESGYFAEADTKGQVWPVAKKAVKRDFKDRGDRWESDFIWNTNWKEQLEYEEAQEKQRAEAAKRKAEGPSGFLSINRLTGLNQLDSDVQEQLRRGRENDAERARQRQLVAAREQKRLQQVHATNAEAKRWARSGRFSRRVASVAPTNPEDQARLDAQVAEERARYDQVKLETQAWASFLVAGCFAAAWGFYTREVAASYGAGALGGLIYLRLLNKSVDGVGDPSVGAALGQPRLLIPVLLTAGYNRWNHLAAAETGLTLQLLPMLAGFFSYKLAVLGRQGLAVYQEVYAPAGSSDDAASAPGRTAEQQQQAQAQQDRKAITDDYNRQILAK